MPTEEEERSGQPGTVGACWDIASVLYNMRLHLYHRWHEAIRWHNGHAGPGRRHFGDHPRTWTLRSATA